MRILLVEDDQAMAAVVTEFLTKLHYVLDVANDGQEGWDLVEAYTYDLILLDVMLPKIDGLTLCRRIRSHGYRMPVLLLTARQNSTDKVMGLDVGADDYVVKPFDLKELGARIRALLRRGNSALAPVLEWGKLHLDPSTCEVTYDDQILHLSPKEYSLLELFLRNSRRVFSRSAILDHLWSWENAPGEDTVKAHIKGLRQKFKSVGASSDLIETVYGMGYRLKPLSSEEQEHHNPQIVAAGLRDELTSWLQHRLALPIQITTNTENILDELERGNWSLLLLDHSALNPTVAKVLDSAYLRLKQAKQSVIYFLDKNLGINLPRKFIGQILFHPLDREEIASIAAEILGLTLVTAVPSEQKATSAQEAMSLFINQPSTQKQSKEQRIISPSESSLANQKASEKSNQIDSLQSAVNGIWEKFKDKIIARLAVLEKASIALLAGELSDELRIEAVREAHKLAGSLGTFGFAEGSALARKIEELLNLENNLLTIETGQEKELSQEIFRTSYLIPNSPMAMLLSNLVKSLKGELNTSTATNTSASVTTSPKPQLLPKKQSRLLIVENDPALAQNLVLEAPSWGLYADSVNNLSAARTAIQNSHPDLVLLDISFGGSAEDGMTLLKELSSYNPPLPVIVLTSRDTFGDRIEVARMGSCAFLRKPMQPAEVMESVNQVLQQGRMEDFKVMAVDDDSQILTALENLLPPSGLKLITLNDSRELWDTLEANTPDLLVLDVDMPYINGIELCQVIRNDPKWNSLPVLFLSSRRDPTTIQRVFGVGADDYVYKPISGSELVTRIFNRLQRIRVLRSIAETDILTGIANRRKSTQDIERLIRMAKRQQQPFCFAMLDLDYFKQVNDTYGHQVGDKVLQRFGRLLLHSFRAEDVVARWGGEEFAIGLYGITKPNAVRRLRQLLEILHQQEFADAQRRSFRVTFSAGVVEYPDDGADLQSLYQNADLALTRAKASGQNCIAEFKSP